MKKITLLAPLTLVPFLLACGNNASSAVNEKEFNNAAYFKDVDYLQVELDEVMYGETLNEEEPTEERNIKATLAPLINHNFEKITNKGSSSKEESYVRINSSVPTKCDIAVKENDSGWKTSTGEKADHFYIPFDYSPLAILQIPEGEETDFKIEPEVTYKNFKHTNDKYVYEGQGVPVDSSNIDADYPIKLEFTFKNKKLVKSYFNFSIKLTDGKHTITLVESDTNMTFAYKKITPSWPL